MFDSPHFCRMRRQTLARFVRNKVFNDLHVLQILYTYRDLATCDRIHFGTATLYFRIFFRSRSSAIEIAACNDILFLDDSRFERSPLTKSPRSLRTGNRVYVLLHHSYRKSHLRRGGEFYGYDFLGNCNKGHQSIILILITAKHETRVTITCSIASAVFNSCFYFCVFYLSELIKIFT